MVLTDITYIPFSDNSFDCIICYHILDQIPDDRQAMRELFRILKPGAGAILQEPIPRNQKETVESLTITSPDEENVDSSGYVFGPGNHVRLYGQDYKDRLEEVGFMVKVDGYVRELPDDLIEKYGLDKNEDVYFCSKPRSKSY
jgi:SAM-dependent methyltransferase